MTLPEYTFEVWLGEERVGTIYQRGDYTRFGFTEAYLTGPRRPVLGLAFEQDLSVPHTAALRLPRWFSNLLPEGQLRTWIAEDRQVSPDREMELLAQVGHDLPGAVRVLPSDEDDPGIWPPDASLQDLRDRSPAKPASRWRFSLAGVGLKFSMVADGQRLTLPAFGEGGDWIVKLPDQQYRDVPRNEYTMMSLAAAAGVEVPEIRLVHRDELDGLPNRVWPSRENWAFAIRRFDRDEHRHPVHIEDLAQVRNLYPENKYAGNFETVAALAYRGHDTDSLREFARRLAFSVLVSNGDAHLKNWSLIYRNPRVPCLSPAYDLVSTAVYRDPADGPEDLGLKFGGSRRFDQVTLRSFTRLQQRLGATPAELSSCVAELVERVHRCWPDHADHLRGYLALQRSVTASIEAHRRSLLSSSD